MFKEHLNYGSFVSDFLKTCTEDNKEILLGLYNLS